MEQLEEKHIQKYRELFRSGKHEDLIEYLLTLKNKIRDQNAQGWIRWNLCDQFALLGNWESQLQNQSDFFIWTKRNYFPDRLHWVVSDSTQMICLLKNQKASFVEEWYTYANENAARLIENRNARFESHRAISSACIHNNLPSLAFQAIDLIASLLSEEKEPQNRDFINVTEATLRYQYASEYGTPGAVKAQKSKLIDHINDWGNKVSGQERDEEVRPLLGSWEQLNSNRPTSAVNIGIHNAASSFAKYGDFREAEELFVILKLKGYKEISCAGECQYLLSCWHNRRNAHEVKELFESMPRVNETHLKRFTPELVNICVADETKRPDA